MNFLEKLEAASRMPQSGGRNGLEKENENTPRKETVAEEGNCGITLLHRVLLLLENSPAQK
jgi:hypothetical protein